MPKPEHKKPLSKLNSFLLRQKAKSVMRDNEALEMMNSFLIRKVLELESRISLKETESALQTCQEDLAETLAEQECLKVDLGEKEAELEETQDMLEETQDKLAAVTDEIVDLQDELNSANDYIELLEYRLSTRH